MGVEVGTSNGLFTCFIFIHMNKADPWCLSCSSRLQAFLMLDITCKLFDFVQTYHAYFMSLLVATRSMQRTNCLLPFSRALFY